jgi:hypothetical protein
MKRFLLATRNSPEKVKKGKQERMMSEWSKKIPEKTIAFYSRKNFAFKSTSQMFLPE